MAIFSADGGLLASCLRAASLLAVPVSRDVCSAAYLCFMTS